MFEYLIVSTQREVSSAPQSRSCSFKSLPNNLEVSSVRPRVNSFPNSKDYSNMCRMRTFKTTSKGVENGGDSIKRQNTNSLMSSGNTVTDNRETQRRPSNTSEDSQSNSSGVSFAPSFFRVTVVGSPGVGKTALSRQLLTSEYVGYDMTSPDTDEFENRVSVLLDGEESIMEFSEDQHPLECEILHVDAFIVAFSITDYTTFENASKIVRHLRVNMGTDRVLMLVANKIDLVRQRKVTANEARDLASIYDCFYIETSAVLNHHVDHLLVESLKQIRFQLSPPSEEEHPHPENHCSIKLSSPRSALALLSKILNFHPHKSKSCNNLVDFREYQ